MAIEPRPSSKNSRLRWLAVAGVLLVVAIWFVHLFLAARQAASRTRLRGQVYFMGYVCSNYRDIHGRSILEDADELGVSWRTLVLQDLGEGKYSDPSTYHQLDTPKMFLSDPFFDDPPGRSTHMFLVRVDDEAENDGWMIVHLPNHSEEWTLPGVLTLNELEAFIEESDELIEVQFYSESNCFGTINRYRVEIDVEPIRLLPWINQLEFTD